MKVTLPLSLIFLLSAVKITVMIFTECCYCDEPFIVYYEAGDRGAGGFYKTQCKKCGKNNFSELVSFAGETLTEEEFWKRHPDAKQGYQTDEK